MNTRSPRAIPGTCLFQKSESDLLEFGCEPGAHRLDLALRLRGEGDVGHVVHAAGDDDLQNPFPASDVAEGAAYARRKGDGVEAPQPRALVALVVPAHLELALEHRERLVGLAVRMQPGPLPGRAHREGHGHAG